MLRSKGDYYNNNNYNNVFTTIARLPLERRLVSSRVCEHTLGIVSTLYSCFL